MKDYLPEHWQRILSHNKLGDFASLWDLDAGWFEDLNKRRGGWSGVSHCELDRPDGSIVGVFLKRQENHITRTLTHPMGMPTFTREMQNILRFKAADIPALEPVYYAERRIDGDLRAILVTEELAGYESLEDWVTRCARQGWPTRQLRARLMRAVAVVMSKMNQHHLQHNCFYPKHIFIRFDGDDISVRIIDLEKTKWRLFKSYAMFRDLYTLNRHSQRWSRTDRLRFFLIYLGLKRLTPRARALWHSIAQRTIKKGRLRNIGRAQ
ncbi:MAG: lipopolysaccharide kinase InaA family protein [Gammaproteobacteria bacterium]|nr:MAG: lipopolysaccharide kinase InaA family protein [Gammaproteobacteria bacterium]